MSLKKESPYYKWIIIAICFLIEFLALGFCSGTKKLFLGPITAALGFERSLFGLTTPAGMSLPPASPCSSVRWSIVSARKSSF